MFSRKVGRSLWRVLPPLGEGGPHFFSYRLVPDLSVYHFRFFGRTSSFL
ncbi:hypothetical protein LEP1GSC192_2694 [Leptospira sp. B5-022]|nr:hypothetical protein LEP1GSC192_2694 [Leptospira sp. B5-022]